jgi:glycosyltransferase involved in cell wall biosynthesis
MATTIHFIYPYGDHIGCPAAIGRETGLRLRRWGYRVAHYRLDDFRRIKPADGDILLGHPHWNPYTIYRRSVGLSGWARRIAMFPFAHGLTGYAAFADRAVRQSDQMLAIAGRYWTQTAPDSIYKHWVPKMVHQDLAIDRRDFPVIKRAFNPPRKRRVAYIGHTASYKNPEFLTRIAAAMPEVEFSWFGLTMNRSPLKGFRVMGPHSFADQSSKDLIAEQDFMLTVGRSDPNPTTILEAMAWGLIPVCTPQSGYSGYDSIPNVPLDDVEGAVRVLRELQEAPNARLEEMREANWQMLDRHFNWDRFAGQVREAIESKASPAIGPEPLSVRLKLMGAAATADSSWIRPMNLAHQVYRSLTGRSRSDPTPLEAIAATDGG